MTSRTKQLLEDAVGDASRIQLRKGLSPPVGATPQTVREQRAAQDASPLRWRARVGGLEMGITAAEADELRSLGARER